MRSAVGLCLLFILYTVALPMDDLEILRFQVRNAKWNIEDIIHQLEHLRTQIEEDTILKVQEKWDEEQESLRSYKTLLIEGIKNEIKNAKSPGKDTDSCLTEAIAGFKKTEDIINTDATKCYDKAQGSIEKNLGFTDNLIWTGNTLSGELDNIFLDCHDSDIMKMKSCIITKLSTINGQVKEFERDVNTAEISTIPVSNNVILQAANCLKKAYLGMHMSGDSVRLGAIDCIEKINGPPTETPTETPTEEPSEPPTKKPTEELIESKEP